MELSYDIISQFAKVINEDKRQKQGVETTVYGVVVSDGNGNKYVKLDGSDQLTPLSDDERPSADSTTTNANVGDRVAVSIKNHTATVTGNTTSPSVRSDDFDDLSNGVDEIKKFDTVLANRVQANEGYIKKLQTDKAEVGDLSAATAKITELEAKKATVEDLTAAKAEIDDLKVKKLDAEVANIKFATVENLKATNAKVGEISGQQAKFEETTTNKLTAVDGSIKKLDSDKLSAKEADIKYAQIQDLNATNANIDNLVAQHADIKNAIVGASSTETGIVIKLTAENATISEALIKELIAQYITVNDLKAGNIITDKIKVMSQNGRLQIAGNTFTIYDENDVPIIQLGQDKNGNYGLVISDSKGAILLDSEGLHEGIVPDNFIKTEMVGPGQITEEKIDKTNIRNWTDPDGSKIFDVSKMYYGDDKFEVSYSSIRESVKTAKGDIVELQDTVASLGNGYTVVLSNESQNIPCTSKGITAATFNIEIPFKGYVGVKQAACTVKISDLPAGITLVKNTPSTDTTDGLVVLNVQKGSDLGESSVLIGSIAFTCIVDEHLISKKFIWTKTKDGEAGKIYQLSPSSLVVKKGADNSLSPATIIFSSTVTDGNSTQKLPYAGRFIIEESEDGRTYMSKYVSSEDESNKEYTPSSTNVKVVRATLYTAGGIKDVLDTQSVIVLTDIGNVDGTLEEMRTEVTEVSSKVDSVEKSIKNEVWKDSIIKVVDKDGNVVEKTIENIIVESSQDINGISNEVKKVTAKYEGDIASLEEKVAKSEQNIDGFKQTVERNYIKQGELQSSARNLIRNSKTLMYKDYRLKSIQKPTETVLTDSEGNTLTDESRNILTI